MGNKRYTVVNLEISPRCSFGDYVNLLCLNAWRRPRSTMIFRNSANYIILFWRLPFPSSLRDFPSDDTLGLGTVLGERGVGEKGPSNVTRSQAIKECKRRVFFLPIIPQRIGVTVSLSFSTKSSPVNRKEFIIKMPKHCIAIGIRLQLFLQLEFLFVMNVSR